MAKIESTPRDAWLTHIQSAASDDDRWIENSKDISQELRLSKRELFSLIICAHVCGDGEPWLVGYDPDDGEPNDGYITNGKIKARFEHKVVAQLDQREVLQAILETYGKYAKLGPQYGKGRILIIHPNKSSDHGGMIKISDLRKATGKSCPFDRVLTLGAVSRDRSSCVIHVIQHYPWPVERQVEGPRGIAEVVFDAATGLGQRRACGVDLLDEVAP